MKLDEAIALTDALKPNQIERERKIEWLNRLDQWIFDQVITPREKDAGTPSAFEPYGPPFIEGDSGEDPGDQELLEDDSGEDPGDQELLEDDSGEDPGDQELLEGDSGEDPGDRELLIPSPYDETYRFYLEMQIDLANLEMDKYANSAALYQTARDQYIRAYNRAHRRLDVCRHHHF